MVFVTIPCLLLGGSEIATLQMVQALTADGIRVQVVVYYESNSAMIARYRAYGAELIFLNERRSGATGMLRLLCRLASLFRKEHPEAVHVQYLAPGMIPILAARLAGIRTVFATVHAAGGKGYGWKAKTMFRISAALTTHFFCVAENTERFWFGYVGGKRHSTLHNGIEIERFAEAAPVTIPGIDFNVTPVIGIVGRVVRLKGHDCLFRATKRLLPEFPQLKILIVGDGSYRSKLEELSRELEINHHIIWCGRVEPESLPGYYKNMTALAMPSHWEGFGLTAAEAMAAGVPVAASDVPGLREVVGDAGLLSPVNDDVVLAQNLKQLITAPTAHAEAGRIRIAKLFSAQKIMQKWAAFYRLQLSEPLKK